MGYECYAVLHQEPSVEGYPEKSWEPDSFHRLPKQAEEALQRWQERRPECKWRVARLREVEA